MASILVLLTYLVFGLPVALFGIPWRMITGNIMPLYRGSMWVVRAGLRAGGIRLEVVGLERVPADFACIFMANHVSNLDPPVLLPLIPGRTAVFLKRSLMKIPVLGFGMRLAEFVPVDRGGNLEGAVESTRMAKSLLARGISITTFVEGTRSRDGKLQAFKKGPFYLGAESGAPCVPISISGTESMMRKGSTKIIPGVARVVFHAPLYAKDFADRESLMAAARAEIASGLPEWMRN
jgi:1-acyl-sn-glycerol-3-phosphate acyltransferase